MARAGRPRAFNQFTSEKFFALIQLGYDYHRAAAAVGCCGNTARREANRDPEFEARWRDAEVSSVAMALSTLRKSANENWRAAAWLLERSYPERYQKRVPQCVQIQHLEDIYQDVADELAQVLAGADDVTLKKIERRIRQMIHAWWENWRPGNTLRRKEGRLEKPLQKSRKERSAEADRSQPKPERFYNDEPTNELP